MSKTEKKWRAPFISEYWNYSTIIHKIFDRNWNFHVKQRFTGKVQFRFFRRFLLVLTKFLFQEKIEHCKQILSSFGIFLIYPIFLRYSVLSCSATWEAAPIYQFICNNDASFHLWSKENLLNNQKVSKYHKNDRVQDFLLLFKSLLTALTVKSSHILDWIYFIFLKTHATQKGLGVRKIVSGLGSGTRKKRETVSRDNHLRNILVKLEFSCQIEHCGDSAIPAFQDIFTSTHKIFILDGELRAR